MYKDSCGERFMLYDLYVVRDLYSGKCMYVERDLCGETFTGDGIFKTFTRGRDI